MKPRKCQNLLECLRDAASTNKGVTFVNSSEEEFLSYNQIYSQAYEVYLHLKNNNIKEKSEIVFQFNSVKAFIVTFWACIMGNYIAVPIATINNEYTKRKLLKIWDELDDPYLLFDKSNFLSIFKKDDTDLSSEEIVEKVISKSIDFNTINTQNTQNAQIYVDNFVEVFPNDEIAYIQYSSGSTGNPKGVIIKHNNVLVNVYDIINGLGYTSEDSFITWKPLTHDFSLVMFHICPVVLGVNQCIIPTNTFIRSPLLWLDKVNQHRSTILGSPPFGIQHLLKFIRKNDFKKEWDLSCIKQLTTGAEQISYDLCQEFISEMEKYNVGKNVIVPLYGLAEATLLLTHGCPGESLAFHDLDRQHLSIGQKVQYTTDINKNDSIRFVEVGEKLQNVEIKITDGDDCLLNDLEIGHIKAKGENVSSGYYKNKTATDEVFGSDGWMDTGDVGFMVNNKIVMVGRAKEIITVRGVNYTCHDLEQTICNSIDKEGLNKYVACNGFNNKIQCEQAIIFVYYKKNLKDFCEIVRSIKNIIYEKIGLVIDEVIPLRKIPKTTSGKIRRAELTKLYNNGEFDSIMRDVHEAMNNENKADVCINGVISKEKLSSYMINVIKDIIDTTISDYNVPFIDIGLVSSNIPLLISRIEEDFDIRLDVSAVFDYPNINNFVNYLYNELKKKQSFSEVDNKCLSEQSKTVSENAIAIIGMSCRFPGGANDPDSFWDLLRDGRFGISEVPEERWDSDKYYDTDVKVPGKMYTKKGGFLNTSIKEFDSQFFNISPKEVLSLDPQQRLLLELVWEAFEREGQNINNYFGTNTGVYVGISGEEYSLAHRNSGDTARIDAYSLTGTTFSTCCGRISYTFGFEGPSICVDTACSSSLSALHIACKDLKFGDTDSAVVAGVNLIISPFVHICFSKLQAISPDGCSKSFDASANGYGRGEGAGVIVLKRLDDAIRDKDTILGVIRGTGVNQDGKSNGLTAPSGLAQQRVIRKALMDAGLDALDIDYIETHGTGTPLGDPIEVKAIMEVYGQNRSKDEPLKIGSVKSNIGHLEAAAGMASILKVLLSLKHEMIPGNLNFNTPNPYIPWDTAPIKVVAENTPWDSGKKPRRIGLNGFGFGGSNAHVILEEAPRMEYNKKITVNEGFENVLKISAKTKESLLPYIRNYSEHMKNHPEVSLDDIIHTANVTRTDFDCRFSVVGKTSKELIEKMESYLDGNMEDGVFANIDRDMLPQGAPKIVFMFSGQGSQYIGMGKDLYNYHPSFRQAFDECSRMFRPYILKSLTELIYSEGATNENIEKTAFAQPLIFAIEYSLCKLWEHMGITPDIVLGHSIGEYAAAVAAKIMSLEDAVKLVAARGRLMDSAPGSGAMGAIFSDIKTVMNLIENYSGKVSIAAYNAAESIVISGDKVSVESILEHAEKSGIRIRKLHVSHGFHSPLMEPILEDFKLVASEIRFEAPKIKFLSSVTGKLINENEILDAEYWTPHIREKVDFYNSMLTLNDMEDLVFIEIGSDRTLVSLSKMTLKEDRLIVPSLNRKKSDWEQLSLSVAELYTMGVKVNWENTSIEGTRPWKRTELPTYPFDRKEYWVQPVFDHTKALQTADIKDLHPFIGQKITTPHLEDAVIYQSIFTAQEPYFMKEHIIFDTAISPAAAHVSMLLSASQQLNNSTGCMIENMEFRSPLLVENDGERSVQVFVENTHSEESKFQIVSKDNKSENASWVKHCLGDIKNINKDSKENDSVSIEELKSRFDASDFDFYEALRNFGFNLGVGFERVTKVWKSDNNEGVCLVEPKEDIPDLNSYILYPGVIDSIFQSAISVSELTKTMESKTMEGAIRTMIPFSIARLKYYYRPAQQYWCHTKADVQKEAIIADIYVYNEKGEIVFEIERMAARLTDRNNLLRELTTNNSQMFYHTQWVEKRLENKKIEFKDNEKFILFADDLRVSSVMEKILSKYDINAVNVFDGEGYSENEDETYRISYESKSDFKNVLQSIKSKYNSSNYTLLYFARTDPDFEGLTAEGLMQEQKRNCGGLLNLVQTITELQISHKVKIWVITDNVHNLDGAATISASQGTLWGFARSLRLEHSQLWGGIIDIDKVILQENGDVLIQEIKLGEDKQVVLRQTKRHVPMLVKNSDYNKNRNKDVQKIVTVHEDASYVITGGTGALGLIYAECLIQKGAKHLVLTSRRGASEKAQKTIQLWKDKGVDVLVSKADISCERDVENLFSEIREKMPPIKGVIHAAGRIEDKMIQDQSWESFSRVLSAKVIGVYNLHNVLKNDTLDFFIMLSSIASIIGNVGQSNYSAANYFLNAFAHYRQTKNLPACAVCWGPWTGSGMAANDDEIIRRMADQGIFGIQPENGMKIIDKLFEESYSEVLAADVNWNLFSNAQELKEVKDFLSKVVTMKDKKSDEIGKTKKESNVVPILMEMKPEERKDFLSAHLQKVAGKIMGFQDNQLPSLDTSLMEQGADSLMIFSMRNEVNKMTGKQIDVSLFFNYPSLRKISNYMLSELLIPEEHEDNKTEDIHSTEDILSEISSLI